MKKHLEKLLIFLFFFLCFSFFSSFKTTVQVPDEEYVIRVAQNITEGKSLDIPNRPPYLHPGTTEMGKDGKRYSTYPIGQSLIIAPFYYLSKKLNILLSPYTGQGENLSSWQNKIEFETTRYLYIIPAIFTALSCLVFYLFCFALNFRKLTCFVTTLLFSFCTIIWPYSKFLLSEANQSFFLLFSVYLLFVQKDKDEFSAFKMSLAGLSFGFLCIIKPPFLALLPLLAAYWVYKSKRDKYLLISILTFASFFIIVFSLQLFYNHIRFNEATNFGYIKAGFFTPIYVGIYGLLFSSGKSFFLYSPITLLSFFSLKQFFKDYKMLAILVFASAILMILIFAGWNVWSGDFCWGPRFLVPLVAFFMLPLAYFVENTLEKRGKIKIALLSMAVLLSLLVQLPAVGVHYLYYLNYFKTYVAPIPNRNTDNNFKGKGKLSLRDHYIDFQFIPEFSPVLGQWWVLKNAINPSKTNFENTPWKGLGFNKFHKDNPLKAKFDMWTINLVKSSFKTGKIENLFYPVVMLFLIPLVLVTFIFNVNLKERMHLSVNIPPDNG